MPHDADAVQVLLDKQAIAEVVYRYGRSMDRLDAELGYSTFWPEAVVDYGEEMFVGTGYEFVDAVMRLHLDYAAHSHQFSNLLIDIAGDTARSECYGDITLRQTDADGAHVDSRNLGRYVDHWERRGGEWRILRRAYRHDFDQSGPCGSLYAGLGTRDRTDASYFPADTHAVLHRAGW